jgi:HNH endonuclease
LADRGGVPRVYLGIYEAPCARVIIATPHPIIMMGCHFQDRPCRPGLCLKGLHDRKDDAPFRMCDESAVVSCPHRAWDHSTHIEVCRIRSDVVDSCHSCGGRHRTMIEACRCSVSASIRKSFEEDAGVEPIDARLPDAMRASAWRMIRKGVIERDGGRCRLCGKDLSKAPSWLTEVHHVRPKHEGGTDHPSNLITLCVMCHRRITADAILASMSRARSPSERFLPGECLEALR